MKYRIRWENKTFDDMGTLMGFTQLKVKNDHRSIFFSNLSNYKEEA